MEATLCCGIGRARTVAGEFEPSSPATTLELSPPTFGAAMTDGDKTKASKDSRLIEAPPLVF